MKKNILFTLGALFLLFGLGWWAGIGRSEEPEEVFTYDFQELFNTSREYINPVDWPPAMRVADERLSCTNAGSPVERAGRSETRVINGREYCITTIDEGAAGSIYTQYAYATEVEGRTLTATFSIRRSQCANFPQEKMIECSAEQETFSLDEGIDRIMRQQIEMGLGVIEEARASTEPEITIYPARVLQGNPARVTVEGVSIENIHSLTFADKSLNVFLYEDKPTALIGIDLRGSTGRFPLILTLTDGIRIERELEISQRQIAQAPLGIPESLGGNTPQAERQLISTLAQEGALISAVPTASEKLWEGRFRLPLDEPVVITDTYGYSRLTGDSTISHKGTDFRAMIGTPVYAMNSGVVRFVQNLRNYGNTIVVDHGLGLHTIYMHLSKIDVALGQQVVKGQLIGRAGDTGYVFGPHLHLTIRINGISIDPERFMELFGPAS